MGLVGWIDNRFYPKHKDAWDDTLFRERILKCITSSSEVLDLGAGSGRIPEMNFKGIAKRVVGIDLDPRVAENPYLDEGKVTDGVVIPFPDESFDLVFSDNVLEHLSEPNAVFDEVRRVLKSGGMFLFKTPNKTHYMPIIATLTPIGAHQAIGKMLGRASIDTFPTHYRANSRKKIHQLAQQCGFEVDKVELIEARPEYLRFTWVTYFIGILYERFVNSSRAFSTMRILLVGHLKKNS